jgi:hypothetical protein
LSGVAGVFSVAVGELDSLGDIPRMIYLLIIIGFGALIAAIPCLGVFLLTKRLPVWFRLLITTFLFALICTPFGAVGEGGAGIVPLIFVLPAALDNLIMGIGDSALHELISVSGVLFLFVWGAAYLFTMVVVGICHFIKKGRAKNVA